MRSSCELHLEHVTREPHAAQRRAEQLGLGCVADLEHAAVGDAHAQRADVLAEAACHVVVLAVHVRGDHAAERHVLRAGRDRAKPSRAEGTPRCNAAQREPGLGAQHAGRRGRSARMRSARRVQSARPWPRGQRRVAVRAPESARERGSRAGRLEVLGLSLFGAHDRDTAPAAEFLHRQAHSLGRPGQLTAGVGMWRISPMNPAPRRADAMSRRPRWGWHLASLAVLTLGALWNACDWLRLDRMPPGDFPGYAAQVQYVRDALLEHGRVPLWCVECYGGTTNFTGHLKEYLIFPLALVTDPVAATKLAFLILKIAAGWGLYALVGHYLSAPAAGLIAGYALAFGAIANHQIEHLDAVLAIAMMPPLVAASVELLRRRGAAPVVALGALAACQFMNNWVHALSVPLLVLALALFRPALGVDTPPWLDLRLASRWVRRVAAALGVFLLLAGAQIAWLASDSGNHRLKTPGEIAEAQDLDRAVAVPVRESRQRARGLVERSPAPGLRSRGLGRRSPLLRSGLVRSLRGRPAFDARSAARGSAAVGRGRGSTALDLLLALARHPDALLGGRNVAALGGCCAGIRARGAVRRVGGMSAARRRARGSRVAIPDSRGLGTGAPRVGRVRVAGIPGGLALVGERARDTRAPAAVVARPFLRSRVHVALPVARGGAGGDRATNRAAAHRGGGAGRDRIGPNGRLRADAPPVFGRPRDGAAAPRGRAARQRARRIGHAAGERALESLLPARELGDRSIVGGARVGLASVAGQCALAESRSKRALPGAIHGESVTGRRHPDSSRLTLLRAARIRYLLLLEARHERLPEPWRHLGTQAGFALWEQPDVHPLASGYRDHVVLADGSPSDQARIVSRALRNNALAVSPEPGEPDDPAQRSSAHAPISATSRRLAPDQVAIDIDAGSEPAFVAVNEGYHPWWRARVDGEPAPVLRASLAMMAVRVGPGAHRIDLRFERPTLVALGDRVAAVAWVALGIAIAIELARDAPGSGSAR